MPCLHHKRQVLAISGDCPALGNWDIQKTVLMEEIQPNEWTITLNVSTLEFPLSYKFVACNADSKQVEEWENHDNRMLNNPELKKGEIYLTPETEVHFTSSAVRWREQLSLYFLSAVRKFWSRRFRRFEETDRLGGKDPPASCTNPPYQRYDHYPYLDGFLSLQQHFHLCIPPDVY